MAWTGAFATLAFATVWMSWPRQKKAATSDFIAATLETNPPRIPEFVQIEEPSRTAEHGQPLTNAPALQQPVLPSEPEPHRAVLPPFHPHAPRNTYELQVALARKGISPGSLDGVMGSQTRAALRAFQQKEHLPITGVADESTKARLYLEEQTERIYTITSNDLDRLLPLGSSWLAKSRQPRLDYENLLELVAERGQASPKLIQTLNPAIGWNALPAGSQVLIPHVEFPPIRARAAFVQIRLTDRTLQAFDAYTNLLAHFPCSIARRIEKRPYGMLFVEKVALNPTYRFDPELFKNSPEARQIGRPLTIPPGPNNPVGIAWIGLNWPGYGIHGSPKPEEVGRTESMGCFRLANWNAEYLAHLVWKGMPVYVEY